MGPAQSKSVKMLDLQKLCKKNCRKYTPGPPPSKKSVSHHCNKCLILAERWQHKLFAKTSMQYNCKGAKIKPQQTLFGQELPKLVEINQNMKDFSQ